MEVVWEDHRYGKMYCNNIMQFWEEILGRVFKKMKRIERFEE